jgi:hypothetical protein
VQPASADPKIWQLHVRLTRSERQKLDDLVQRAGVTPTMWLRATIDALWSAEHERDGQMSASQPVQSVNSPFVGDADDRALAW